MSNKSQFSSVLFICTDLYFQNALAGWWGGGVHLSPIPSHVHIMCQLSIGYSGQLVFKCGTLSIKVKRFLQKLIIPCRHP